MVINLRNVITLGILDEGIYPSVYDGQSGEYVGTVDGTGNGIKTIPTIFMYYRKNGHLYLYRTLEKIEIDLTNVTAYDNSALFKLTEKDNITSSLITEFDYRNIDVGHYEYKTTWVKSTQQYLYILVPIVRSISTITIQGIISNQLFNLIGIYVHEGKSWWIYRTNIKSNLDFNDAVNEILDIQVYVRELVPEDLAPVEQLTLLLTEHIANKFNPHNVTKEQVGLGKVDNTSDYDKPISKLQKEYIDSLEERVKSWFKQLNVWINNHVKDIDDKLSKIWKTLNEKLDSSKYENDKEGFYGHIKDYKNPHKTTAEQIGLGNVNVDINTLQHKTQELQKLLIDKQDKSSDQLETDNKTIVNAINEIFKIVNNNNNNISSDSLNKIEVTTKIPSDIKDGILWIRIPRNDEDYINVNIESIPVDSNIEMINSEGTISTGIGSCNLECLIQSRLHYIITKDGYITKDIYLTLGIENLNIQTILDPKVLKTLNITASPANSIITIKDKNSGSIIITETGSVTYSNYDDIELIIEIKSNGYITHTENILLDSNINRDITLEPIPIPKGYINISVLDSENKTKIGAYIYDKLSGDILGQVTKDKPLWLSADLNTSKILRIVNNIYIEQEITVIYENPVNEIIVELVKIPPVIINKLFEVKDRNNNPITNGLKARYTINDSTWIDLIINNNKFNIETQSDTRVIINVSATNYIAKDETLVIQNNTLQTIILEEAPPEPIINKVQWVDKTSKVKLNSINKVQTSLDNTTWINASIIDSQISITGTKGSQIYVKGTSTSFHFIPIVLLTIGEDNFLHSIECPKLVLNYVEFKNIKNEIIKDDSLYFRYGYSESELNYGGILNVNSFTIDIAVDNITFIYQLVDTATKSIIYQNGSFIVEEPDNRMITIQYPKNPDGIDYMEIEGDGNIHPIFRILSNIK